ncbi:MAG: coproporphyrinogen-III oxidase family protein, partial [Planctomycetota bacterium]
PETADAELFDVLVAGGVNRLSIGAQSFNETHLKTLERWHDPASVAKAVELARRAGIGRRSVDLIYAIPGQTADDVADDLDRAFALPIDHVSAYNLTYEPNTAMTVRRDRGEFVEATEDTELEMFWLVRKRCIAHGFEPYEVSNFARPGSACRHNLAYWRQDQWLAAGPSASGHVGGHRYKVIPRLADYLDTSDGGFALVTDHEPPDAGRALAEVLMTGIRLSEGLDLEEVLARADAIGLRDALVAAIDEVRANGWLLPRADRLVLSDTGLPLADHVASVLMSAVG